MAAHSNTLAWKIPWTEEPSELQAMGPQRLGHSWVTEHAHAYIHIINSLNSQKNIRRAIYHYPHITDGGPEDQKSYKPYP